MDEIGTPARGYQHQSPPFVWGLQGAALFSVDTHCSTAYDAARFDMHWAKHQALTEATLPEAPHRAAGAMGRWIVCVGVSFSLGYEVLTRSTP